jgi:hypothetical protein
MADAVVRQRVLDDGTVVLDLRGNWTDFTNPTGCSSALSAGV